MSAPELPQGWEPAIEVELAHVEIRTRESGRASSAWRLHASCAQGSGTITRVEGGTDALCFRGEGAFLGWPQARLAAGYQALLPQGSAPEPDPGQFG